MAKKGSTKSNGSRSAAKPKVVTSSSPGFFRNKWGRLVAVIAFVVIGAATLIWASAATTTSTLWHSSTIPKSTSYDDGQGVEVGTKFKSKYSGTVIGLRFYKGVSNTGTHTGSLWTSSGKRLATVTFSKETATGWQTAYFAQPIAISAKTNYVISYYAPHGHYAVNVGYFKRAHNGPGHVLRAPKNAGVYNYSGNSTFPNKTYKASNYWVDPLVSTSRFTPTPKPTAPSNLKTEIGNNSVKLTWSASPTSGVTQYKITRDGTNLAMVDAGTLSYTDKTVQAGKSYTYKVTAAIADGTTSDAASATAAVPTSGGSDTTTPTPPPVSTGSASCTPSASATFTSCGFPNASNTGVSSGTKFTAQSASAGYGLVVTQDNTVISGLNLNGWIDVEANNVTIENSVITSNSWWGIAYGKTKPGVTGLRILHNKITSTPGQGPDSGGYDYAISQQGTGTLEIAYNDISGFKDGSTVASGANIHDNYIHDLSQFSGAHTQGIYVYSGSNPVTIENNTIVNQTGSNYTTAAIYIAPDSPNHNNVTVKNNWLSGGAFTLYAGDTAAKNIKITNNFFSTEIFSPKGSLYGPVAYWQAGNSGNVWSGNVWANGSQAGQTINP